MQIFFSICILALSIFAFDLLGREFCISCRFKPVLPERICIGFFLYFSHFQIVAECLILTKQKLHVLTVVWIIVLLILLGLSGICVYMIQEVKPAGYEMVFSKRKVRPTAAACLLLAVMAAAIVCECVSAVLMQRNIGWDFAYYIGNMTTSVATDTMYLYDGSSGLLRNHLEMRYALSAFYMNTAWISQITGISALVLQKYMMGILCVLLTNAVVYSFAMEVFHRDQRKAAVLVTITILLTVFWDVYDTTAQFLLLRNYEAKAYCANVVLPMVCYLMYRIWKNGRDLRIWAELFLVAFASVPVSMSSLVLVPALIGLMVLAHLIVERRWDAEFVKHGVLCMMPNVCYFAVYFASTRGWLIVEV